MTKRRVNIILGVLATVLALCVLLIAGGTWFAMSVLHREQADERSANAAFAAARARFRDARPLFELRPEGPVLTQPVPASEGPDLHTMHILNWEPEAEALTRADLPFALLRLKEGPMDAIPFANVMRSNGSIPRGVPIRVRDIERFGPALLVDEEREDGGRVLIWTE